MFEQAVEQSAENHRVADVADEKFIEAQHAHILCKIGGDGTEWIFNVAKRIQPAMHLLHDPMKVDAALGVDRERLEEQVHEKRLAATHATPDIQPSHTGLWIVTRAKQALQPIAPRLLVSINAALQFLEQRDRLFLGGISHMIVPAEIIFVRLAKVQFYFNPASRSPRKNRSEAR